MRKIIPLIVLMALSVFFTKAQNVTQAESDLAMKLAGQLASSNDAKGLPADVISNSKVFYTYEDAATGIRYVSLQQVYKGIPVYNQILALSFRNGKLLSNFGALDPNIEKGINVASGVPSVSAESAVQSALSDRGFRASQMAVALNRKDEGKFVEFGNLGISRENITAQLTWVPNELTKTYSLAWQVYIIPKTTSDYWMVRVNAVDNSILGVDNYTDYDNWGIPNENPSIKYPAFDYGKPFSNTKDNALMHFFDYKKADDPSLVTTATYRVVPIPAESPLHPGGTPALRTDPWLNPGVVANAVTLKWHTGAAAADYDYSRSNNVWAYEDRGATNTASIASSASSQTAFPNLTFDFVPDFTQEPIVNTVAVPNQRWNITNLFYWNNIAHDILYGYGFTEAGKNFQDDNLGRGGNGNDHVNAEAQDLPGANNANFSTPADGGSGRMQMYLWTAPTPDRDGDVDNGIILHELGHGVSNRSNAGGVGCLGNQEQAGEGWSDYIGLMLTQNWATATVNSGFNSPRGIGTYALNQANNGPGIRPQRYCTDFAVNNATYATLPSQVVPHGVGWVFCSALWEMTWELINDPSTTGIEPNIYNFAATGGNVVAMRLMMEGLRTQQCQPGFISARNAILTADQTLYAGVHTCAIWRAFARRGMGFGAAEGSTNSINDQTVSFAMPPTCVLTGPTVTINQAAAQPDPTTVSPINFTVVFSEAVVGFATGDVSLGGTAGATLATVTGGPTTFNVAVTGMTTTGTVIASIAAGVCTNAALDPNNPSTSTDNTVTFTTTPPGVCTTFVGNVSAADPSTSTRSFRDGIASTCAVPGACGAPFAGTFQHKSYTWTNPVAAVQCVTVTFTNLATNQSFVTAYNGPVTLANLCTNYLGDPGSSALPGAPVVWSFNAPANATIHFFVTNITGGQSADFQIDVNAPICVVAAPSVTINQAAAQADPTSTSPINFTAVFSEAVTGFTNTDVVLTGTAGATTAVVTGGPTTYNVAVSGMTGNGTVIATIPAGVAINASSVPNTASTSTDNTVTYNVPVVPCVSTFSYTGPAVAIPDITPAGINIPITISGSGTITDLDFRFDAAPASTCDATPGNVNAAADHTFIGDLVFTLTSPNATSVVLVNRRGGTRENICTTLLDDDGAFPSLSTVTSTSGQFLSGNFAPDNPLSAFDGQNANGVWTLNVSDNAAVDIGSLRRFSLIITSANPTVNTVANQTVCAGSPTAAVNFTGTPAGATYNWTNSAPAIGLAASGTGNIASFTAVNATAAPIVATITVTPTTGTCTGAPTSFTITVNPTPSVNAIPNQVVCRNAPTAPVNFTGTPAGAVFTWTNNTPAIGLAAAGTGNIPSFIAQNPGSTPLVATITVTPVTGLATPVVTTFNFTGAVQTFTVPAGITSVNLKTWGAQGNSNAAGIVGGLGGYAEGNLAVVPGQILNVLVGGGATTSINGGFNGGGAAGTNTGCAAAQGGGGGGASDVRIAPYALANRVIVGAGGGGAGANRVAGCGRGTGGGGGGGLYGGGGGAGWPGVPGSEGPVPTGGTQAAGGAGGITTFTPGPTNGLPGALALGGAGGTEVGSAQGGSATAESGGIGGGLTGGSGLYNNANNWCGQSGAGGSSYIGGVSGGITTAGLRSGAGQVQVTYTPTSAATCVGTARTFTITVNPNASLIIIADPGTTICEGDPTLLTVYDAGAVTGPGTLYTQGTGVPANGSPSQVFEPLNAPFDSQGADDFTIPNGGNWNITQVTANGIGTGAPTSVNVFFYTNAANLPGTAIASFTNITTFTRVGGNYTVTLPSSVSLGAGTYWMSFQVNMSFAAGGQWFWGNFGTTNVGNEYAWRNPGGGFATPCANWGYGATGCLVGGTNRNNIFSIIGTSVGLGPQSTGTFLWSPAAGLSSTTSNPVAASPMNTTTYTVNRTTVPGGCVASAQITITVNKRPVVTVQPVSRTNCSGTTATFTVGGTGTGLTYQWQVSTSGNCAGPWVNVPTAAPYSGGNGPILSINPVSTIMNGYAFRVVLGGTCAPFTPPTNVSNCVTLTVNPLPNISITPPVSCGGVQGISGTLLTVTSNPTPVPGNVTVSSGAINVPIPDGSNVAATSNLTVAGIPANATITEYRVNMNIGHSWVGDVDVNLRAPNNNILNLVGSLDGGAGGNTTDNFTNTTFNSNSTTAISGAAAPRTGNFAVEARAGFGPIGFLQTVNSWNLLIPPATPLVANGLWTLAMGDGVGIDIGSLTSWSISIDYTTPGTGTPPTLNYVWSPLLGLFNNSISTIPYLGTNTPTVYASPTVQTVYTATATNPTTGCVNTATALVNYTPPAPTVTPSSVVMCLGDAAVKLKASSSTTSTVAFNSGAITVPVPDANVAGASHTIAVGGIPANATVTGMRVKMTIPHTFIGDLVIALRAPNNNVLNLDFFLSNTFGGVTTGFSNTIFTSVAGAPAVSTGTNPYSASFRPDAQILATGNGPAAPTGYTANMASFAALMSSLTPGNVNGNYTLAMYDGGAIDVGTLTNWEIEFTYVQGVVASPAVWTPATGLFSNAGATIPYVAGTRVDSVWTRPAVTTTYQVTVNNVIGVNATPSTPLGGTNTNAVILFNVRNNNAVPVTFTSISSNASVSGAVTSSVYVNTTAIAGPPAAITAANGWNQFGTGASTVTAGVNNLLISGLTLVIPANTTYGIALQMVGAGGPAYTNGTGAVTAFSNGGCDIIVDGNVGWGGFAVPAQPLNNPRNFNGSVTLVAAGAGTCTSPATSVTVTVNNPTTVITQPVSQVVCTDKVATFTVAGGGTGPFSYRWQVSTNGNNPPWTFINNGGVYSGANTATLTITAPPVSMDGYFFRAVVNGAAPCAADTSFGARLTVNPLPDFTIKNSPTYTSLFPGLTTTLSANLLSATLPSSYRWLRNGVVVDTTATYLVNIDRLGTYQLSITDRNGCTALSKNTITIKDSISGSCFIYPNPTSGQFEVRYYSSVNNIVPRSLIVFDAKGDRVFTKLYPIGRPYDRMPVDLRAYSKGLYWVEVIDVNGNRLTMCRVVIQ